MACGVITVAEHPRWARTLQRMRLRGQLARILPGIYCSAASARDFRIKVLAVLAKDPDAVITGRAALVLANVVRDAEVIEFYSQRQLRLPPGLRRMSTPVPVDQIVTRGELRFAHPRWSALEVADQDGGAAIDDALRLRVATAKAFNEAIAGFNRRRRNRIRRRILWESRDEPWSQGERALHGALRKNRITGWVTNLAVECEGRRRYLDVAFPKLKLAIEFDGREIHGSAAAFEDDRERQNALVAQGWTVLRVTWTMLSDEKRLVTLIENVTRRLRRSTARSYTPSMATA